MTSWRVATSNIRHGLGPDGRVDLTRTAREIASLEADVVGLQEVDVRFGDRSDHEDQAGRLGELLGRRAVFGAVLDLPPASAGAARRRYGPALLTEHEVLEEQMHLLPAHPGVAAPAEPRGVLRVRLRRADGSELEVLVTHLDNVDRAHRTAQVQGIVDLARDLEGPAVLLGDMNAEPGAPELAALPATGWQDAAGRREDPARTALVTGARADLLRSLPGRVLRTLRRLPGRSGVGLGEATHPAALPLRRIDQLWTRGDLAATALRTGPRGGSDHLPVVAELRPGR